jgi:hypothetical protein
MIVLGYLPPNGTRFTRRAGAEKSLRRKTDYKRVEPPISRAIARSGATTGCAPFARNRPLGRRMGGKGRLTFVTVYSLRCDASVEVYTESKKHQPRPRPVPGCERHPTACDWSSIVGSERRLHAAGRKAVSGEPDVVTPLSMRLRMLRIRRQRK